MLLGGAVEAVLLRMVAVGHSLMRYVNPGWDYCAHCLVFQQSSSFPGILMLHWWHVSAPLISRSALTLL